VIRVGFVLTFTGQSWLGGASYFRNLLSAVSDLPERTIEPIIITRPDTPKEALDQFPNTEVLRTNLVCIEQPWWKIRRVMQKYLSRDYLFENFLLRNEIKVLSHSGHLGSRCPIRTLPWIPDFQELHLPTLFSMKELAARARQIDECCKHSTAIVLSSHSARRDLQTLSFEYASRAKVLPFVAAVPLLDQLPERVYLEQKYGFDGLYFHLPNQFWKHKSHETVVNALEILRSKGISCLIISTGNLQDYRHPDHFNHLMDHISKSGLQDNFRVLGVVPYLDLMGLMANSVAVINPSVFEGWSTTVEEAKSFGKTVLLSDIEVHREQSPCRGHYFEAGNSSALADAITNVLASYLPISEKMKLAETLSKLPERRRRFAELFEQIVHDVNTRG